MNENYQSLKAFLISASVLSILLSSCSFASTPSPNIASAIQQSPVPLSTLTSTIHATTIPTRTKRPTSTITLTQYTFSTRSPNDQLDYEDIFSSSAECKLPCIFGFTPGISPSSEIANYYAYWGLNFIQDDVIQLGPEGLYGYYSEVWREYPRSSIGLVEASWDSEIIRSFDFYSFDEYPTATIPKNVINELGDPEDVALSIEIPERGARYNLRMVFPDSRTAIVYQGLVLFNDGLWLCLSSSEIEIIFTLIHPDLEELRTLSTFTHPDFISAYDYFDMQQDDLIENLSNPSKCLKIDL
jgi:hypothetical protein